LTMGRILVIFLVVSFMSYLCPHASLASLSDVTTCRFNANRWTVAHIIYSTRSRDDDWQEKEEGTGFVISDDGYLVTAAHVVGGRLAPPPEVEERVEIRLGGSVDEEHFLAGRIVLRHKNDAALIRIDGSAKYTHVTIGNSSGLDVGDQISGVGYPKSY